MMMFRLAFWMDMKVLNDFCDSARLNALFILGGCVLVRSRGFGKPCLGAGALGSGGIDEISSSPPRVVVVFGFVARRDVCSCVCMYGLSVMCRADRVYTYRVQGDGDEVRELLSGDGWSNFGNPEVFLE